MFHRSFLSSLAPSALATERSTRARTMSKVDVVSFDIPSDTPQRVADKVREALDRFDGRDVAAVQFVFRVRPGALAMRPRWLRQMQAAVEPFRARVGVACRQNVIEVPNAAMRVATRAALAFFKPDVPTIVVTKTWRNS